MEGADKFRFEAATMTYGHSILVTIKDGRYCIEVHTETGEVRNRFLTSNPMLSLMVSSFMSVAKSLHDYAYHLHEHFEGDPIREHVDLDKPLGGGSPLCGTCLNTIAAYNDYQAKQDAARSTAP